MSALLLAGALPVQACWDEAAARYQVSSTLLHAIARTESGLHAQAIALNRDGSRDIGLMQINSRWLTTLAHHGINEQDLLEPCISIQVGAWILAQNIARYGNNWEAVGAYNAVSPQLRAAYVEKVRRNLLASTAPYERLPAPPAGNRRAQHTPTARSMVQP
jgi:soluble lytic murein transglycosylase-like protein